MQIIILGAINAIRNSLDCFPARFPSSHFCRIDGFPGGIERLRLVVGYEGSPNPSTFLFKNIYFQLHRDFKMAQPPLSLHHRLLLLLLLACTVSAQFEIRFPPQVTHLNMQFKGDVESFYNKKTYVIQGTLKYLFDPQTKSIKVLLLPPFSPSLLICFPFHYHNRFMIRLTSARW